MITELDDFTRAFFECALWGSNDESDERGGEPLDKNYSIEDIAEPCMRALAEECKRFQAENAADLATCMAYNHSVDSRGGHLFWLTRNGYGAGFWDGDYPEAEGERLTTAAEAFGNVELYVHDGEIWATGYAKGKRCGT